jgi:hypothetical protein
LWRSCAANAAQPTAFLLAKDIQGAHTPPLRIAFTCPRKLDSQIPRVAAFRFFSALHWRLTVLVRPLAAHEKACERDHAWIKSSVPRNRHGRRRAEPHREGEGGAGGWPSLAIGKTAAKGTSIIPVPYQCKCIGCSPGKHPGKTRDVVSNSSSFSAGTEAVVCRRLPLLCSVSVVERWTARGARRRSCLSCLRGRSDC